MARKVEVTSDERRKVEFRKDISNYKLRQSKAVTLEPIEEQKRDSKNVDPKLTFFIVKTREDRRKEEAKTGFSQR